MQDIKMIQAGRYNVRKVSQGDRYGLNDCVVHEKDEPLVEFYLRYNADGTVNHKYDMHGERGWFVSRYYVGTLLGKPGFHGNGGSYSRGLCLHGGGGNRYEQNIEASADEMRDVLAFISE